MKKAFTLAEVLITLTIIGVIAALTIPNLMQKWSDHADVVKVKEAYSILSNAMKMAIAENGPLDDWAWDSATEKGYAKKGSYLAHELSKYLKIKQYCNRTYEGNCGNYGWNSAGQNITSTCNNACWFKTPNGILYDWNGPTSTDCGGIILQNGMIIPGTYLNNNNGDGSILVDINGKQKPNRIGYDLFYFHFNKNGFYPNYIYREGGWNKNGKRCSKDIKNNGETCSVWVLKYGNMDYKYRDVGEAW